MRLAGLTFLGLAIAAATMTFAQQERRPLRVHTATEAQLLVLEPATQSVGTYRVSIHESGANRIISSNALPAHLVGVFPNRGNPNPISAQDLSLAVPLAPQKAAQTTYGQGWVFGVSLYGVPFDPFAAEFWQGNRQSGWSYDPLGGAIPLGLDANYAHVQPDGTYHYHGMPFGLLELVAYTPSAHSPLVGYAADGFPIYARTGSVDGQVQQMTSSWQLKPGNRPGGESPSGAHDGTFNEDYEYVEGLGTLDRCNGAMTVSSDYPAGTYAYFITDEWPVIPRCFAGTPSQDFKKGPRR